MRLAMTIVLVAVVSIAWASESAALSSPSRLLIEYMPFEPAASSVGPIISTTTPRLSFLPHAQHDHPGKGATMSAYRIVVMDATTGQQAWDSGATNASSAVSIKCG